MEARTATGFSFEAEFEIWGYSLWGDNEFVAHISEDSGFDLERSSWDWRPRKGEVTILNGGVAPEWWRLPYVVKQYAEQELGENRA